MWSILNGTIVNALTVAVGSTVGLTISSKLPERYRLIVLQSLGLVTIVLGVDASVVKFADTVKQFGPLVEDGNTYAARVAIVMIASLLIGAIIGTALRLHERIESFGQWLHAWSADLRVGRLAGWKACPASTDGHGFAEGFLTASVIFCVGPLTLIGCLRNGAEGDPSFLYIKALLDGFCSMALAASLGWGVLASIVTILGFQGGLSLLAFAVAEPLDDLSIALMTMVGGVVLLATALMILEIKKIPVANLLPGIFLPPVAVWISESIWPGLLLPLS